MWSQANHSAASEENNFLKVSSSFLNFDKIEELKKRFTDGTGQSISVDDICLKFSGHSGSFGNFVIEMYVRNLRFISL